jgi:hypothetical protein
MITKGLVAVSLVCVTCNVLDQIGVNEMKINRPELVPFGQLENGSVYVEKGVLLMKVEGGQEVNLETGSLGKVNDTDKVHWLRHATLYPEDK